MAKNRIRHLEFYGYPDQNIFTGFGVNPINVDDIREKNKEQDEELENLDDEKVDKSDFNVLSGVVDTFIGLQTEFNDVILDKTNQHDSAITAIHDWIEEFSDDISAYTEVDERLDAVESGLTELEITVSGLTCDIDGKADKDYVDGNFPKKDDVYTKDEVDALLEEASGCCESCVTESWLEDNGYLTEDDADGKYATKDEISGVSAVTEAISDINGRLDELSGNVDILSSFTTSKVSTIETNLNAVETRVDTKLAIMSGLVITYDGRIHQNEVDIDNLEREMDRKANRADLESLERRVTADEEDIAKKVNKADFNDYKDAINDKFDEFNNKKADKSDISALTEDIAGVEDMIASERSERQAADSALSGAVDTVNERVNVIAEENVTRDDRLDDLESALVQEIADRIHGDLDLIGSSTDSSSDNTIWGAKKYAVSQRNQAITEANNYTNQKIAGLETSVNNSLDELERQISQKADTDYVNEIKNELKEDLRAEIDSKVDDERMRAEREESLLHAEAAENRREIVENDQAISNLADRVNAITAWEGTDPEQYDNTGNGVLDVLHREFHEFAESHGMIKDIKVVDGNLVITYYTKDGEAESVIPVGEIVDLQDYYTKEETENLIEEAISGITFDDYYTKEETDAAISGAVSDIDDRMSGKTDQEWIEDKLGSGFTGENSGKTVTEAIDETEQVVSAALNDLNERKMDASAYTPTDLTGYATEEWVDGRLGSGFTGDNSGKTVTEAFNDAEQVTSAALNDLNDRKLDASAFTGAVDELVDGASDEYDTLGKIEGKVEENKAGIQTLLDKLGYTNNETLVTNNDNEVAFGKYNVSNTDSDPSGKTVFSVGIGTSDDDRKNAVEIKQNGDVYLWVEGDFMCINQLLGQLAHETYYDNGDSGVYDDGNG